VNHRNFASTFGALALALLLAAGTAAQGQPADAAPPTPKAFAAIVGDSQVIGNGPLLAYRGPDRTLLSLPKSLLDRLFFWYVEAARFPEAAVAIGGNSVAEAVVSLERQGSRLLVRDRSPAYQKRSASGVPDGGAAEVDPRRSAAPIDIALDATALGPVIAALPILADADGRILLDITATFSNDIDGLTASKHIVSAGVIPAPIGLTVDAARSYIADVDVYPDNLHVRSHLTFRAQNPGDPLSGFQPISIELGHSLIVLPEKPMAARRYDDRVGFIFTNFTEFEGPNGEAASDPLRGVIKRHRLVKADPTATVSDPVKPIVFYIGQGVPERWRKWIAQGIESWQPAFRAAGFSNAIIARNAPTPAEDPDWSPEDARYNVIRWVPQPYANAQGPSVADPRSGEILFAHILLWPQVLNFFSDYYWLMAHGIDPAVSGLPLSETKQGELLRYIVAHEVGHSIGLRHNHLASTAYTVAELGDPAFANSHGANASIMAYGRMNQVAQPGKGITQVLGAQGPYDFFAIDWGYGTHGSTPAQEQAALDRLAAAASEDRLTRWGAGEAGFEDRWAFDPRVQMENVGAERVEATRLGLGKLALSVAALDAAAPDDRQFKSTYQQGVATFDRLLGSVVKLVGGQLAGPGNGSRPTYVPAGEQRAAVAFLLDEGPRYYDALARPALLLRADPTSGDRTLDAHRAQFVRQLLAPSRLALIASQHAIDPAAYSVGAFAADVSAAIWGDLEGQPAWRAAQQAAYLDSAQVLLHAQPNPNAAALQAALADQLYSPGYIANQLANGTETVFPAYLRQYLPALKVRLEKAAKQQRDEEARLHLLAMAARIEHVLKD
jgi:hypothetical protein